MPTLSHSFEITFSYDSKSLTAKNLETTETITDETGNTFKSNVQLIYCTFNRKLYQPNEIVADIRFTNTDILNHLLIFYKSKVELVRYEGSTAKETYKGFYVYNVIPLSVPNQNLYIRFHIFSLDHQLTLKKYSRTYVAKKLGVDILSGKTKDSKDNEILEINYNRSKEGLTELLFPISIADQIDNTKTELGFDHLSYSVTRTETKDGNTETNTYYLERIQPYLVQYNESFYDFMVRTANRCGEFFFWDGGKLRLGRSCASTDFTESYTAVAFSLDSDTVYYTANTNDNTADKSGDKDEIKELKKKRRAFATEFYVLDDVNKTKDFKDSITSCQKVKDNIDDKGVKGQYLSYGNEALSSISANESYLYNNEVNQDVYRTRLYKDRFDSLNQETVGNVKKYFTSLVSRLLNETNIYDFLKKFLVSNVLMTGVAAQRSVNTNDFYNDRHIDGDSQNNKDFRQVKSDDDNDNKEIVYDNLFTAAVTDGHLNSDYYNKIRQKEESLSRQLITIKTTTPSLHWLGEEFTFNSVTYVIVQIKMKLGTNQSKFSNIDAAAEAEFRNMNDTIEVSETDGDGNTQLVTHVIQNMMEVVAIPVDGSDVYPPMHPAGHVRHSDPQVAFVEDPVDPQRRGRVRIKYPWQHKDDNVASPWIRVLTPSATPETGCAFEFLKGDEVLVNYEGDNVERPYVAGASFNKGNAVPFRRGDMTLISRNGHGIAFNDPIDFSKFIAGISPAYNFVNQFLCLDTTDLNADLKLTGGTTITDAYGIYKIEMSTDQRKIDIRSPFGTVNIDAFQGISICAPNGDINIKGQNINIEAGNDLRITSGTNIKKKDNYIDWNTSKDVPTNLLNIAKDIGHSFCGAVLDFVSPLAGIELVDLDLLRKVLQVFLRPIDGTLQIKSHQYLMLEAGPGEAFPQPDRYKADHEPDKEMHQMLRTFANATATNHKALVALQAVIEKINLYTEEVTRSISTEQRHVQGLMNSYTNLRSRASTGEHSSVEDTCIDAAGILSYAFDNDTSFNYMNGADNLHIKETHEADAVVVQLKVMATALSNAAHQYFSANKSFKTSLTQISSSLVANSDKTAFFDYLKNAVDVAAFDNVIHTLGFDNDFKACNLSMLQINEIRKYIKHLWFSNSMTAVSNGNLFFGMFQITTPYTINPENWDEYVSGLQFNNDEIGWKEWVGPLADVYLKYTDALVDFYFDRDHWEAGKSGQILFSDKPHQSFYFDQSGSSHVYLNDWSHKSISLDNIKAMLKDL